MEACLFRKARPGDAETVYSMVAARVQWMDEQGIRQWNVTEYLQVYPLAYYQEHLGQLYLLEAAASGRILCAAVLLEQDVRWSKADPAFYIHNLVSDTACSGAGKAFLREAEGYARRQGKQYLRLDSADDNEKLEAYYAAQGFIACGTCSDGAYHGTLREKKVTG